MANVRTVSDWNWRLPFACVAVALIMVPALGSMLTTSFNWGAEDFLAAAVLLAALYVELEVATRIFKSTKSRLIVASVFGAAAVAAWAQLAVGLI